MSVRAPIRRFLDRPRSRGQSFVELALVLPVLLLIVMIGLDFGRIYLGWVNVQQMARLAANYAAENATAWNPPGDLARQNRYQTLVRNDARQINCELPPTLPDPIIASGTALGAPVVVNLSCGFTVITPIISQFLGGTILVNASATFPIKEGAVAAVPGGGAPVIPGPAADFSASPRTGWAPLAVTFTDLSTGAPTSWTWSFSLAPSSTGGATGSASMTTSFARGPHTVIYDCEGDPGDTCTFGVSLQVSNAGGFDTRRLDNHVTVTVPPDDGPIAEFTASPRSGVEPLTVTFQFQDLRQGAVDYTNWQWDFTNNGTFDASGQTVTTTYQVAGSYDVRLRVTDSAGTTHEVIKVAYIIVSKRICIVPDFANVWRFPQGNDPGSQARWNAAGFTTTVQFLPPTQGPANGNYRIRTQTIVGGTIDPQPDGCGSTITVGP